MTEMLIADNDTARLLNSNDPLYHHESCRVVPDEPSDLTDRGVHQADSIQRTEIGCMDQLQEQLASDKTVEQGLLDQIAVAAQEQAEPTEELQALQDEVARLEGEKQNSVQTQEKEDACSHQELDWKYTGPDVNQTRADVFQCIAELRTLITTKLRTPKAIVRTSGAAITPAEVSEGHALVYKICTESSQPKDAENQCYTLFLDYCRGICGQFPEGKERRTALQALKAVFKYLDQLKQTSSSKQKQDLKTSAAHIAADPLWTPVCQSASNVITKQQVVPSSTFSGHTPKSDLDIAIAQSLESAQTDDILRATKGGALSSEQAGESATENADMAAAMELSREPSALQNLIGAEEFLKPMPEDIKAEMIAQLLEEALAEDRAFPNKAAPEPRQSALTPAQASCGVQLDFLDALPPDLRAEVILQWASTQNTPSSAVNYFQSNTPSSMPPRHSQRGSGICSGKRGRNGAQQERYEHAYSNQRGSRRRFDEATKCERSGAKWRREQSLDTRKRPFLLDSGSDPSMNNLKFRRASGVPISRWHQFRDQQSSLSPLANQMGDSTLRLTHERSRPGELRVDNSPVKPVALFPAITPDADAAPPLKLSNTADLPGVQIICTSSQSAFGQSRITVLSDTHYTAEIANLYMHRSDSAAARQQLDSQCINNEDSGEMNTSFDTSIVLEPIRSLQPLSTEEPSPSSKTMPTTQRADKPTLTEQKVEVEQKSEGCKPTLLTPTFESIALQCCPPSAGPHSRWQKPADEPVRIVELSDSVSDAMAVIFSSPLTPTFEI